MRHNFVRFPMLLAFQVGAPDPIVGGFPTAGWRAQPTMSAAARRMTRPEFGGHVTAARIMHVVIVGAPDP